MNDVKASRFDSFSWKAGQSSLGLHCQPASHSPENVTRMHIFNPSKAIQSYLILLLIERNSPFDAAGVTVVTVGVLRCTLPSENKIEKVKNQVHFLICAYHRSPRQLHLWHSWGFLCLELRKKEICENNAMFEMKICVVW